MITRSINALTNLKRMTVHDDRIMVHSPSNVIYVCRMCSDTMNMTHVDAVSMNFVNVSLGSTSYDHHG